MNFPAIKDAFDSTSTPLVGAIPWIGFEWMQILQSGDFNVTSGDDHITVAHGWKQLWMLERDGTVAKYAGDMWFQVNDKQDAQIIIEGIAHHVKAAAANDRAH